MLIISTLLSILIIKSLRETPVIIFFNDVQFWKASTIILVTELGITTLFNEIQSLKAAYPIEFTGLGIFISSNDEHWQKTRG